MSNNPYTSPSSPYQSPIPKGPQGNNKPSGLVMAPAITMIVIASLAIILNLIGCVAALVIEPQPIDPSAPEFFQEMQRNQTGPVAAAIQGLLALASVFSLIAAIQMLRFKSWGIALAGTIVLMLNCGNGCCLLGMPVGIWAIIVLSQPNVKKWFN